MADENVTNEDYVLLSPPLANLQSCFTINGGPAFSEMEGPIWDNIETPWKTRFKRKLPWFFKQGE